MIVLYDKMKDMKPEYNFDLRSDIGRTFVLKPIDGNILSYKYHYDEKYIHPFNKTKGRWHYKNITLMLIDDELCFLRLPNKIKRFMYDNANQIFVDNCAIKITIKQEAFFMSVDDIHLVGYHKTYDEIYNIYENSGYNLYEQIIQSKKIQSKRMFNIWENDVLVNRSIGEVEKIEQRIKKLKSL